MANFNLNEVILGGRLVADPELKQTQGGVPVVNISIAVNRRFGEKQADGSVKAVADFINVIAWRQTAELISKYFRKGSSICIVGSIQTRSWVDKQNVKRYATDVVCDEAHFVDSKGEGAPLPTDADAPSDNYYTPTGGVAPQFETISGDDEFPF